MYCIINSAVCDGIEGRNITVETEFSAGLPYTEILGHPGSTVVESGSRVKTVLAGSGFSYPRGHVTVNLAPAGIRKTGSHLDLPIAIGILASQLYTDASRVDDTAFFGELSLDGKILHIEGLLPMLLCLQEKGIKKAFIPAGNYEEARLAECVSAIPVSSLTECIDILNERCSPSKSLSSECTDGEYAGMPDFADVRGQQNAKRAICIAVAGNHGLFMKGGPGCGKTMLAKRIPSVMPPMSSSEIIECAVIRSVAGERFVCTQDAGRRPFRMPHHSTGAAGLLGGGSYPLPGEITLAHNGVLFLDEFTEFDRTLTESMRIPVEQKKITHIRHGRAYTFPCNFLPVIAANPCKCGFCDDPVHECTCTAADIERYERRLGGPLFERIDIHIGMQRVDFDDLRDVHDKTSDTSASMRSVINGALEFAALHGRETRNGDMADHDIRKAAVLSMTDRRFMEKAYDRFSLTPRAYMRILRVARTIADMEKSESVKRDHLAEALSYRDLGKRQITDEQIRR